MSWTVVCLAMLCVSQVGGAFGVTVDVIDSIGVGVAVIVV